MRRSFDFATAVTLASPVPASLIVAIYLLYNSQLSEALTSQVYLAFYLIALLATCRRASAEFSYVYQYFIAAVTTAPPYDIAVFPLAGLLFYSQLSKSLTFYVYPHDRSPLVVRDDIPDLAVGEPTSGAPGLSVGAEQRVPSDVVRLALTEVRVPSSVDRLA